MQQQTRFRRFLTAIVALAIAAMALPAQAAVIDDPAFARGPLDLLQRAMKPSPRN